MSYFTSVPSQSQRLKEKNVAIETYHSITVAAHSPHSRSWYVNAEQLMPIKHQQEEKAIKLEFVLL